MESLTDRNKGATRATPCHIVIAGGGLAGLSAAIALRLVGHNVTVLERMPVVHEIGAGIQVPPNASRVLANWGLLEAIESHAFKPHAAIMRSYGDGKVLSSTNLYDAVEISHLTAYMVIHRADLHKILYEKALDLGVAIHLSSEVSKIDFAVPSLELTNGETYTADVILGADGERSACQRLLRGFDDPPKDSGDEVIRFTVKCSDVLRESHLIDLVHPPNVNFWIGPEAHAITYSLKKDGLLNVVLTRAHAIDDQVKYGPQPADIEEVRKAFAGWDPRFERLLGMAQQCAKWTLLLSSKSPKWTSKEGTFALLGDAAHAMLPFLGQGAAQAFEDAAVLGVLFSNITNKTQIPEILLKYEKIRVPRTEYLSHRSLSMKEIFAMKDGDAQRNRDIQLLQNEPIEGFPNPFSDPVLSKVMWEYDAGKAVDELEREDA